MKQSEAMEWVRRMRIASQRARTVALENDPDEAFCALLNPWLFGKGSILRAIETHEARGAITPADFISLMQVARLAQPLLGVAAAISGLPDFPPVDLTWRCGWEPESEEERCLVP